jgi:hypothetical protein
MGSKKFIYSLALALSLMNSAAHAKDHYPPVLEEVIKGVEASLDMGYRPVVVFDIDDTLINTRGRNVRIIREFGDHADIKTRFPAEAALARGVSVEQTKYLVTDTLKALGAADPEFLKAADEFWLPRFFSDRYCAGDKQIKGAARFVQEVVKFGGHVVYLTGRDIPRMEVGTKLSLRNQFFPTASRHATLMMKPSKDVDDLEFKRQALSAIAALGEVVAVFENEPANLNLLADSFPRAKAVFLDTIHSPKPDQPLSRADWIKDFIY